MAKKDRLKQDEGFPLSRKGLAEVVNKAATEKVPLKLRSIDLAIDLEAFKFELVSPESLGKVSDEPTKPLLPKWIDQRYKPKRVVDHGRPKEKLEHRGRKVDPLVIFGSDDRRAYDDTSYPWGCVCKVIVGVGYGSGVIVGPRHVLTASHTINWAVSGGVTGSVEVNRAGPAVSAISRITQVCAFTRVRPGDDVSFSELDEDYAVVITADRIGDRFGWLGTRTYNSSWDDEPYWINIGYSADRASSIFPLRQSGKELDEHAADYGSGRLMDTTADVNRGQSGGPMFAFWRDGPYAVAVVSAQNIAARENYCSGGSDLPRLVRVALTRFR